MMCKEHNPVLSMIKYLGSISSGFGYLVVLNLIIYTFVSKYVCGVNIELPSMWVNNDTSIMTMI
jgi:hypothetical protein